MNLGYDKALYLLPFDHRRSYVTGMFDFKPPLSAPQHDQVSDSKQLIYEGFRQAVSGCVFSDAAGILVDEEFGTNILRDAHQRGFVTALPVEQSGTAEFDFEYGSDFASHIETFDPSFAKVLVNYNPEGDGGLNQRHCPRLKLLSDYCRRNGRGFMFELLVPATQLQMTQRRGDQDAYDRETRPLLMQQSIRELQDAGIEPDVWKIEGLTARADCEHIVDVVRRDGRNGVGCIVLGHGADETKVRHWLATAASVRGFIGFAVGRTTFWDAVAGYRAGTLTRVAAAAQIAGRLREWIDIFELGRLSAADATDPVAGAAP